MERKRILLVVLIVILALSSFGLAACAGGGDTGGDTSADTGTESSGAGGEALKIGFSPYGFNQEFHRVIATRVKEQVEADGNTYIEADPAGDGAVQIDQVSDLIAQDIDILIISAVSRDGIIPAIEECKKAGVKVINYDCEIGDQSLVETFVTSDNFHLGQLAGEYFTEHVTDKGKVIIFDNPEAEPPTLRQEGFDDAVKDTEIESVYVHYNGGDIRAQCEDAITANPDAVGFFGTVSIITTEAYASIDSRGLLDKIKIISVDGSPDEKKLLEMGGIIATAAQSTNSIADKCVELSYKVAADEAVEKSYLIDGFIIDKENLADYDVNGWQ